MDPSVTPTPPANSKQPKKKRASGQGSHTHHTSSENTSPIAHGEPGEGSSTASNNFRNVSACNRCRLRKNKCDQKLPACTSCEKAHIKCVGFDPVSKREIPRRYAYSAQSAWILE